MNTHTHEEISQQAEQLWRSQGCPEGHDTEIWLEAERNLSEGKNLPSSPEPDKTANQAAAKKERARAPQVAQYEAPKSKPAELGKPLWPQPQSS
ncbi:DUF2934 domain-containing protein [Pelagicoccus sp. SDUM812003]|uniref:DUF2934 domain-containing protein n=1 Tax=Pelagicoccus sp. SDUM812003 TaxID=3041267 RepID=UPI00280F3599|nr:DUF2934 domain-containing protein [Pelagicoccus sp. SDUM812003]MDQ8204737.1 DUF2934 domain-containing protein [Pelagicoccus sp. SDUM812003]